MRAEFGGNSAPKAVLVSGQNSPSASTLSEFEKRLAALERRSSGGGGMQDRNAPSWDIYASAEMMARESGARALAEGGESKLAGISFQVSTDGVSRQPDGSWSTLEQHLGEGNDTVIQILIHGRHSLTTCKWLDEDETLLISICIQSVSTCNSPAPVHRSIGRIDRTLHRWWGAGGTPPPCTRSRSPQLIWQDLVFILRLNCEKLSLHWFN